LAIGDIYAVTDTYIIAAGNRKFEMCEEIILVWTTSLFFRIVHVIDVRVFGGGVKIELWPYRRSTSKGIARHMIRGRAIGRGAFFVYYLPLNSTGRRFMSGRYRTVDVSIADNMQTGFQNRNPIGQGRPPKQQMKPPYQPHPDTS
jgi:hypothetical protein